MYDPNQSGTDDVALRFDIARPSAPIGVTMEPNASDPPDVICFFRVGYGPETPPAALAPAPSA